MTTINIDDYPQLSMLCWNRAIRTAEESEALQLYENGWRFIEKEALTTSEHQFIRQLANRYGNGVLNV